MGPILNAQTMEFGAHLPVLSLAGERFSIGRLTGYATAASQLGYKVLCANDHLAYSPPHLDSLTSLAVVIETSGQMKLMTSIALLVIRGAARWQRRWPRSTCFPAGE